MTAAAVMTEAGSLGHQEGSPITGGVFTITSAPRLAVKIRASAVYAGPMSFSFTGGSSSVTVPPTPPIFVAGTISGAGVIQPTAIKTQTDAELVIREGDTGTLSATGTLTAGGSGAVSGIVEVTAAGQYVLRGA